MIRSAKVLAVSAALMFVSGSIAAAAATGVSGAGNGGGQSGNSSQCEVVQNKTGGAGVFDVTRGVVNGKCVCYAKLAPNPNQSVAAQLADLLRSRDCSNSPAAVQQQSGQGGVGSGALIAGGAAVAGGVIAAASGGHDSP